MILKKIISGFQSGADIGGIKAASFFGIETGGWIPKGFLTENGSKPEYKQLYNAQEHNSHKYQIRTVNNVKDSDGTLRFAKNFYSAGEKCTLNALMKYSKPYYDIHCFQPLDHETIANWIIKNNIQILNIAGNRETTCPGIEEFTFNYLIEVFNFLKHK